jgi:hypothetical protein
VEDKVAVAMAVVLSFCMTLIQMKQQAQLAATVTWEILIGVDAVPESVPDTPCL